MAPLTLAAAMNTALSVYGDCVRGAPVRDVQKRGASECRILPSSRAGFGSIAHVRDVSEGASHLGTEYCFFCHDGFMLRGLGVPLPFEVSPPLPI